MWQMGSNGGLKLGGGEEWERDRRGGIIWTFLDWARSGAMGEWKLTPRF